MRKRVLDAIIDLCILLDRRFSWRWIDRLFLWAWEQAQADVGDDETVMLYDASARKWYRCDG